MQVPMKKILAKSPLTKNLPAEVLETVLAMAAPPLTKDWYPVPFEFRKHTNAKLVYDGVLSLKNFRKRHISDEAADVLAEAVDRKTCCDLFYIPTDYGVNGDIVQDVTTDIVSFPVSVAIRAVGITNRSAIKQILEQAPIKLRRKERQTLSRILQKVYCGFKYRASFQSSGQGEAESEILWELLADFCSSRNLPPLRWRLPLPRPLVTRRFSILVASALLLPTWFVLPEWEELRDGTWTYQADGDDTSDELEEDD